MRNTKIIRRGVNCPWRPKEKFIPRAQRTSMGIASLSVILAVVVACAGGAYLVVMNRSAVHGYEFRQVEREVKSLSTEHKQLIIREAELRSLQRIEEETKNLNMTESPEVSYIGEQSPFAYK